MADLAQNLLELPLSCSTLVGLLRYRATHQPHQVAFTFLQDGEVEVDRLTYHDLDTRSRAIAAQLQALDLAGERALLLYPPGLDYLAAFFGCLYAGVVAVPAYPPRNHRNTPRILAIAQDAEAAIVLSNVANLDKIQSLLTQTTDLSGVQWLATDSLAHDLAASWQEPTVQPDTLAFLQYTSGSTGTPKGVMLSHGNLIHNAAQTYVFMGHSPNSTFVSWLPVYHDMGLIGGILQPLYGGFPCILMAPASFLQRPYRWLKAISDYRATTSGGPNFAYELCCHKITPEQRATLDLSHWAVAFNGAEPIRHATLTQFAETFAECGFRPEAAYPCYGLAEGTLMVTGSQYLQQPVTQTIQGSALEQGKAIAPDLSTDDEQVLVSSGRCIGEQTLVIANPETRVQCQPGEVGEVWVSGPSVGHGYWHRPEETQQTFEAYLAESGAGPFMRTGDLGFLQDGELFITGRAKDLIIIRGRNLYPQDIEQTAERSHPSLRITGSAAFTVEAGGEEKLVVVQEVEFRQKPDIEETTQAIRRAVAEVHEVQPYAVVLIKAGTIPKTSSGKIQRRACRAAFLAGELEELGRSSLDEAVVEAATEERFELNREILLALPQADKVQSLTHYLQTQVAQVLGLRASIDTDQPLTSLGLDSLKVFELKNRIDSDFEIAIAVSDLFDDATIATLVSQILEQISLEAPATPALQPISCTGELPLSFAQERMFFLHQLQPHSPFYNIAIATTLTGNLNVEALKQSLNQILQRHEALRTEFVVLNGQPMQRVATDINLELPIVDLTQLSPERRDAEAVELQAAIAQQPFALDHAPLIRAQLLHLTPTTHQLILSCHHIVFDGWSAKVFFQELAEIYAALVEKRSPVLTDLPVQYADFAQWQRQWLVETTQELTPLQKQLDYWKQQLAGDLPVLQLPTDRLRPAVQTFKGAKRSLTLDSDLAAQLKALSQQEGSTLFMTLLAAFKTLLYRYTGQTDLLVGAPIANRNRAEVEGLVGFFVNTLVLRSELTGDLSFRDLLQRVRKVALEAYAHQDVPFEKLVEAIQPERDPSYTPLFQVMFDLQEIPTQLALPDLTLNLAEIETGTAKFALTLAFVETEQGLLGTLEYNSDLFEASTMQRMVDHLQILLTGIVANPDQALAQLPLLTASEQELLAGWNPVPAPLPQQCIHQLFEAQVEQTPDAIALIHTDQQLTYQELNQRANQLAHHLQQAGVGPDTLVGLCVDRSVEMIVGLLGILKAGGAYVPLDPTYPAERLAWMLADSQASVLVTQQSWLAGLPLHSAQVICLDQEESAIAQAPTHNPISQASANNLAYIIYTSGSTGKPKGVMIEHQALVNFVQAVDEPYRIQAGDRVLQFASLSFDTSAEEIFPCLTRGATLVLRTDDLLTSPSQFWRTCQDWGLTVLDLPTAYWHELVAHFNPATTQIPESVRLVIIGGEAALAERVTAWQQQVGDRVQLINTYGPTETTIVATAADLSRSNSERSISIGRPLENVQAYVLDPHQQPVPVGIPGELYIAGSGLARGYLNRPDLTAERFVSVEGIATRLYRTGDRVRFLPDGNLEFLGRIDQQVKIRGFRVELGEIEAALTQHAAVQEAVVTVREDQPGQKRLVAYIVPSPGVAASPTELKSFLKAQLPDYMMPAAFVTLSALPLTPNGKVDRRALPQPEATDSASETAYVQPQSELEQAIAAIWQEVLQVERVGLYDNFFDLGGHSLLLIRVHQQLSDRLQREFSVVDLFQYPTVHALASHFSQSENPTPALQQLQDRVQKQRAAISRQKQFAKRGRNSHE